MVLQILNRQGVEADDTPLVRISTVIVAVVSCVQAHRQIVVHESIVVGNHILVDCNRKLTIVPLDREGEGCSQRCRGFEDLAVLERDKAGGNICCRATAYRDPRIIGLFHPHFDLAINPDNAQRVGGISSTLA
jgi:hypothetical protein